MTAAVYEYAPALVAWAAVLFKLPSIYRRPGDWPLRAYCLTLFSLALSLTLLISPVYFAVDSLLGAPNIARLLTHSLALVASWSVQAFLAYLNGPEAQAHRHVRRSGWVLLVAVALMAVFFFLAPVDEEAMDFVTRYANAPFVLEYRLVFLVYLGFALFNVVRLSWGYARVADRPALDLGLRVVAAGAVVGLGYVTHEAARVVAAQIGVDYPVPDPNTVTSALLAVSILLTIVGSTLPSWGAHVGIPSIYDWLNRCRSLRQLYPLWRTLCEAAPEIALTPPPSPLADALNFRDLRFRLYRRVVEIRDGELALRRYLDTTVPQYARVACAEAGIPAEQVAEIVEAACLAAAIRARARGQVAEHSAQLGQTMGESDVAGEAAFLGRVAQCRERSPIVTVVLARLERQELAGPSAASPLAG